MRKNPSTKARFLSYYSSVFYTTETPETTPPSHTKTKTKTKTISVPIQSPPSASTAAVPVFLPESLRSAAAAVRIQSAYRSHMVRRLVREISAVNSEAGRFEELIRRQETVDAVRSDDRERLRVSEGLMSLLLRLDGVRGIEPTVRELRRSVSRRIVALQEVVDAVSEARVEEVDWFRCPLSWEEIVGGDFCGGSSTSSDDGREGTGRRRGYDKGFDCLEKFLWGLSV